jgi:molybdopterin synthase catalytic subunit
MMRRESTVPVAPGGGPAPGGLGSTPGQTHKEPESEPEGMKPLAVVGPPDADTTGLVERLAERLAERGRVGTVARAAADPTPDADTTTRRHRAAGAARTYTVADDGWVGAGDSLSLSETLGRLARSCDYALVEGWQESRLPTVALGGAGGDAGEVLQRAPAADAVDLSAVVEALETVEPYETLPSLVDRVKESPDSDRAGAIATFTGRVRVKDSPDDEPTEYLEFEKYEGVADERMATLREELEARDGIYEVRLHHRTGVVEGGVDIVFVVVLAGHRREAFRTVEDGIDRLKEEVPLFKKEVTVDDTFWAHEQ